MNHQAIRTYALRLAGGLFVLLCAFSEEALANPTTKVYPGAACHPHSSLGEDISDKKLVRSGVGVANERESSSHSVNCPIENNFDKSSWSAPTFAVRNIRVHVSNPSLSEVVCRVWSAGLFGKFPRFQEGRFMARGHGALEIGDLEAHKQGSLALTCTLPAGSRIHSYTATVDRRSLRLRTK